MKRNSVNYKKGKMDIGGVTGKFTRTKRQNCRKCCFYDECGIACDHACYPSVTIDEYLREVPPPFGRGHFERVTFIDFYKALTMVKAGDKVRIDGATKDFYGNGVFTVVCNSSTAIAVNNDLYNRNSTWLYRVKSGRAYGTNGGNISAVKHKGKWVLK